MHKTTESDYFIAQKRSRKIAKRQAHKRRLVRFRKRRVHNIRQIAKSHSNKYKSIILDFIRKGQKKAVGQNWTANKNKYSLNIELPSNFSIIHAPMDFLRVINNISSTPSEHLRKINIDHSQVKILDLAAESILSLVVMELKKETKHRLELISGYLPEDNKLDRYIRAIGIIKNLDVSDQCLTDEEQNSFRVFTMRSKRFYNSDVASAQGWKESAIQEFVNHINTCLNDNGKRLTKVARAKLSSYTGEILNNAEDHSGHEEVVIVGYLDNSHPLHLCEISIFNFGKTIAETFRDIPDNSYTKIEIDKYISVHSKWRFFGEKWSKNDLLTLVALQGHISSKNYLKEDDRGQGTVDLIDFFQRMHRQCVSQDDSMAEMAILSGNTHIYFDGTYVMKPDNTGRKVIAFNKNNSLSELPDHKYVKNLGEYSFPGTIISIRFPMKSQNIESVQEEK